MIPEEVILLHKTIFKDTAELLSSRDTAAAAFVPKLRSINIQSPDWIFDYQTWKGLDWLAAEVAPALTMADPMREDGNWVS